MVLTGALHDRLGLLPPGGGHGEWGQGANDLTLRYGQPVGVLPELITLPTPALGQRKDELDGDGVLETLWKWYAVSGPATVIAVTDYRMFSAQLDLRSPFLLRSRSGYALVSTADLRASLGARGSWRRQFICPPRRRRTTGNCRVWSASRFCRQPRPDGRGAEVSV